MQSIERCGCAWCDWVRREHPELKDQPKPGHVLKHDCIDHLQIQQHEWIEPHGEPCFQEWWICSWCDETFTEEQINALIDREAMWEG